MYLTPLTATSIDQAVLLDVVYFYAIDEARRALVLTPTCDFAQQKCELVQVCAIFDAWETVEHFVRGEWAGLGLVSDSGALVGGPLSKGKFKDFANSMRQLITQRLPRYHWLAPLPGEPRPQLLDFQLVESVSIQEVAGTKIVGELASPFREQVSARYAAYMGRVGTPDFGASEIDGWVSDCVQRLFPADGS